MNRKRRYRRGYPVALLVGLEADHAVLWHVFSRVVKLSVRLELDGRRSVEKSVYNFYESIVDAIKTPINGGTRSIIAAAPPRTPYTSAFLDHIQKHHRYLTQSKGSNRVHFSELVGSADNLTEVAELVKTKKFTDLVEETTSNEADQLVALLEKHLYNNGNSVVLYSLKEIEDMVYSLETGRATGTEYLLLTDKYLADSKQKNRIHRLMQIASNKKVKTRVVNAETTAGNRISQFEGLVFFTVPFKQLD